VVKAGNDLRMHLSISQLSDLTGRDRRTIAKQLKDIPYTAGDRGAFLYESVASLPVIYTVDSLEAARAKQALSQASLNAVREEDLRKRRIPVQIFQIRGIPRILNICLGFLTQRAAANGKNMSTSESLALSFRS